MWIREFSFHFSNMYPFYFFLGYLHWLEPIAVMLNRSVERRFTGLAYSFLILVESIQFFLEKAMATYSSTLAWKTPWEEPGRLQSMGSLESDTTERLPFHFSLSCIGEGNGNPLQCSCLENPRDGGAWRAAVFGVAQSRTWLKRLSSSSIQFFHS